MSRRQISYDRCCRCKPQIIRFRTNYCFSCDNLFVIPRYISHSVLMYYPVHAAIARSLAGWRIYPAVSRCRGVFGGWSKHLQSCETSALIMMIRRPPPPPACMPLAYSCVSPRRAGGRLAGKSSAAITTTERAVSRLQRL